jgi:hypothetical protein
VLAARYWWRRRLSGQSSWWARSRRVGDDGAAELSQQLRDGDGDQPGGAGVFVAGALEGGGHDME